MSLAAVIGLLVVAWVVYTFNRLTRLRQLGDNAWSDIDVQLKRRHDLIPNVVAVVQGHAGYERGTLEALVAARGRALQASDRGPALRAREEAPLGGALQRVIAVAEAYPELKAAASFAGLQTTLIDVEDHLQNARRYYNAVARDLNTAIAQFPAGIVAGMMRLHPREFFGLDDPSERAVPKVPIVLLLIALSASALAAQRSYSIDRFDVQIRVNRDASIDVTETITARFVGSWNGLYRTIPVTYRTPQGLNWTLAVSLRSAQDDGGRNLRTETSRQGAYIKYKVWIPGAADAVRTLVLRYHATNGLRFFDEHDELYWNVTGDEWEVPIRAATAEIEVPPGTPGVRAIAFNGVYGSTAREATVTIDGNVVRIVMPRPLGYHEGVTAVVGWNKGVVTAPSVVSRAAETVGSNWPLLIPLPVLLFAFLRWRRSGADPRERPITVQYEPPKTMTPAEAGTLIDNSADMRDITATLVDLAVRGYLRIEEQQNPKLFGLFGGGTTYTLHRLKTSDGLAPHEVAVLTFIIVALFAQIMPARTEPGTRALEQVLGFEEFLRRVEAEHLKRIILGHPELFDKYLPYAMAFGVELQFARAFEGIYTQPPQWYVGPSVMNFNVSHFSSSVSHLTTVAGTTLSSSPRSSGGSGFGGGGGSGGGGGGGGGGAF